MSVWKIAWRSVAHRGLGSALTVLSMALGVMLVVGVLTIHGIVSESLRNNSSFGYNVIVGARGGSLQLTLNTVYYLSRPVENIPYEYYLAFLPAEDRERELRQSFAWQVHQAQLGTHQLAEQALGLPGLAGPLALLTSTAQRDMVRMHREDRMGIGKRGLFAGWTEMAIPLALGDYYRQFRVVGTIPALFDQLVLDADRGSKIEFAQGRPFQHFSREHGYFEAVVGSIVARQANIALGDTVYPVHGDPDEGHVHDTPFTVAGIMAPTGTAHDRVVYVNLEGFYLMDDHAKPIEPQGPGAMFAISARGEARPPLVPAMAPAPLEGADPDRLYSIPLPVEEREVTSILVRTRDDEFGIIGMHLPAQIGDGHLEQTLAWSAFRPQRAQTAAQAVNPVYEVAVLFQTIVDPIQWLLLALAVMICIVAGISILVGIYNSMNQRQREIAVMRALGASRSRVMSVMLVEAIILSLAGGLLGWVAGHGLNVALSPVIEERAGVQIGFFDFAPAIPVLLYILPEGTAMFGDAWESVRVSSELLLVPGLIGLAILVGLYPAITAYRTDVAKSLSD